MTQACDDCLRRPWLLRKLAGHLDPVRGEIGELLALGDGDLIAAVGGRRRQSLMTELDAFTAEPERVTCEQAGIEVICRCDPQYPSRLLDLESSPTVLHVSGGMERFLLAAGCETVALVGSRRASAYGLGAAESLARDLTAAGVPVVSGMAAGIDSASHHGAMTGASSVDPATIAVLPGGADRPYPRSAGALHRRILTLGAAVSELPPRAPVRSWMFLARNRIIAALSSITIVIEAGPASAALLTARTAAELGREVGAVPGRITAPQARGSNCLIKGGAHLISCAQDVLDLLFEAGTRCAPPDDRAELNDELRALVEAIGSGRDTPGALFDQGGVPEHALAALAWLELEGYIRRGAGGRFSVLA